METGREGHRLTGTQETWLAPNVPQLVEKKSEKRGVHAARNGPSADSKCWQRIELGIHGLKSWDRNWSRKVRETRSSSSQKGPEHCSVSTTSVNRRGQPSMPRAELGTALPAV